MNPIKELEFKTELAKLINRLSLENESDTPDFVIAEYLFRALKNYNETVSARTRWGSTPKATLKEVEFKIDVTGMSEDEIKSLINRQ